MVTAAEQPMGCSYGAYFSLLHRTSEYPKDTKVHKVHKVKNRPYPDFSDTQVKNIVD